MIFILLSLQSIPSRGDLAPDAEHPGMARRCEILCLLKLVSSGISIWYTKSMRAPMFSANLVFPFSDRPMMDRSMLRHAPDSTSIHRIRNTL
jgi:hypothetical protein